MCAPSTQAVETNQVTDPYSVALTTELDPLGGRRPRRPGAGAAAVAHHAVAEAGAGGRLLDLRAARARLLDRRRDASRPSTAAPTSRSPTRAPAAQHLRELADAGLNTVHLLPTFDITSIEEVRADQAVPDCDLESFAPDSTEQQACVTAVAADDGFNWGYDPYHWMAPEGSYATAPEGGARVAEFRTMVGALHADGLRVVLDEVYNHTSASGQARHLGARQGRARVLPPAEPDHGRGRDQHLLPEHRHRARDGRQGDGRRDGAVGQAVQGRRLPVRPDGPPLEAEHARRPRGARQADPEEGRRRRQGRSTSTARAGTSARWRTTRGSSRPPRASSAAPASGPSPTGCATPSAAVARSTRTRASRASAPACSATRTATPAPTRPTSWRRGRRTPPT